VEACRTQDCCGHDHTIQIKRKPGQK